MSEDLRHEVTDLLLQWNQGNKDAVDRLMPIVVGELRRLASTFLRKERCDHTLQPTALVNELYLRLVERRRIDWHTRAQFFAFASHTMRRILVDHARTRNRSKRGSGACTVSLTDMGDMGDQAAPKEVDLLALDEALTALAEMDDQLARIVELRFYTGLSTREIGAILEMSAASVSRQWAIARGWLFQQLTQGGASR